MKYKCLYQLGCVFIQSQWKKDIEKIQVEVNGDNISHLDVHAEVFFGGFGTPLVGFIV